MMRKIIYIFLGLWSFLNTLKAVDQSPNSENHVPDQFPILIESIKIHKCNVIYFIPEIITAADSERDPFAQKDEKVKEPRIFANKFAKISGDGIARLISLLKSDAIPDIGVDEYGESYDAICLLSDAPAIIIRFRKVKGVWYIVTSIRDSKGRADGTVYRKCSDNLCKYIDSALADFEVNITKKP